MISRDVAARAQARLARLLSPPAGPLVRFVVGDEGIGWITPDRARRLASFPTLRREGDTLRLDCPAPERTAAMAHIAGQLAGEGALTAWRDERYGVRSQFDAPPLFELERAAARYFGIHTYAAHVNGLVRSPDGTLMWLARRSEEKPIDAGMLDNLVGGGIAAGTTVAETVARESWEEAGIAADVSSRATGVAELTLFREQPDGIQHETIYAHDLWLPPDWTPASQDGEAVGHRLASLAEVARIVAGDVPADAMTADASLVAWDCLARLGVTPPPA
jgi:8-oxo-dGTP pyrophosphatase MutT (NUDIX family)